MKSWKKWLSGVLCLALLLGLLPTAALAANAPWADSAVTALNGIYESGIFSADDAVMTESDLNTLITATKWKVKDSMQGQAEGDLTRGKACEVLAYAFDLPVPSGSSAIQYLYDQHIINGKDASGSLGQSDPITKAEFAVITYRVLNSVGGGKGSSTALKPGTKEYFAWMCLSTRTCLGYQDSDGSHKTDSPTETMDEATLDRWKNTLNSSDSSVTIESGDTKLDAAVKVVEACGIAQIFADVNPGDWYYDGVMYLFDHGIVAGYGDGSGRFGPGDSLTRVQLASILLRTDGANVTRLEAADGLDGWEREAITYVTETKHYMTQPEGVTAVDWWRGPLTRQDAIVTIMKWKNVNTSGVNTAILDRFSDAASIPVDAKPYIAYAVSLGIVNGTGPTTLGVTSEVNRGMFGVLLYRTLLGADKTKMKDYADNVSYAKGEAAVQTFALFAAPAAAQPQTLTLREDWRLTSDLDLAVPEGTTLTINGNGHHIYEMGGILKNTGEGTVTFADGTILYPAAGDTDVVKVTVNGTWDAEESNALMLARHPVTPPAPTTYTVTVTGSYSADPGAGSYEAGENVTVDAGTRSEYSFAGWTASGVTLSSPGSAAASFVMPSNDVVLTAHWSYIGGSSSDGSSSYDSSDDSDTTITTERNPDGSTTTTVTDETTGTVTETTRNPDGSQTVVETKKDGTVTTTETTVDKVVVATVDAPDKDVTATVTIPQSVGTATVTIPASVDYGMVAVDAKTGEVVKLSVPTEGGMMVKLDGSAELLLVHNAKEFTDTTDHWAKDAIDFASAHELFGGTDTTKALFSPDAPMTRAMLMTVLARFDGADTTSGSVWYEKGMEWAKANGVSDGTNPDGSITREQLATMLWRYAGSPAAEGSLDSFTDADKVSDYAVEAMRWVVQTGIISGMGDGVLSPKSNATRAQVATIMMRYVQNLTK